MMLHLLRKKLGAFEITLCFSHYPTKESIVQLVYILTDEDNLVNPDAPTSERESIYLACRYSLTKKQSLELRYSLTNGGDCTAGTAGSQNQSIHLTYDCRF